MLTLDLGEKTLLNVTFFPHVSTSTAVVMLRVDVLGGWKLLYRVGSGR
jgi:hypothetical protein